MKKFLFLFISLIIIGSAQTYAHTAPGRNGCKRCANSGRCVDPTNAQNKSCCGGLGYCKNCLGDGEVWFDGNRLECTYCHGDGKCHRCNGTGKCPYCHGDPFGNGGTIPTIETKTSGGSSNNDTSTSEEDLNTSKYSDTLGSMDPLTMTVVIGAAAVLSYGVFGAVAITNWKTPSSLYPSIEGRIGYSYIYGENLTARAYFGGKGGLVMYAGLGSPLQDFKNSKNAHAGIGFYISPGAANNISWTWEYGKSYRKSEVYLGYSLLGLSEQYDEYFVGSSVEYSHFFGRNRRHGFFVGAGLGYGSWDRTFTAKSEDELKGWKGEFRLGYTFRFLNL